MHTHLYNILLRRIVRASTPHTLHSSAKGLLQTLAWLRKLTSMSLPDTAGVEPQDDW